MSDKLYPKGTRVRCVKHGGAWDGFWTENQTPEIGEVCTIMSWFKIHDGGYVYTFYEYQQHPPVAFDMDDFEVYTGKIIINEQPTVETKDRKPIP